MILAFPLNIRRGAILRAFRPEGSRVHNRVSLCCTLKPLSMTPEKVVASGRRPLHTNY
jgi:hypothetical protein